MGRILAIDYGLKRTGLAVTDALRIIATPLDTVPSQTCISFLRTYFSREPVDEIVIGMPRTLSNQDSEMAPHVRRFIQELNKHFPDKPVHEMDERFTSSMAKRALIDGGMKKKDRRDKSQVDKVSATILLQDFLASSTR